MFQFADAGDFAALIKRQRDVCKQLLPEPQILGYEEIFDKGQHGKQVGTGTSLNLIKVFGTVLSIQINLICSGSDRSLTQQPKKGKTKIFLFFQQKCLKTVYSNLTNLSFCVLL